MFDELFSRGTSAWRWVKCPHHELIAMGLPEEIPWPGEIPDPVPGEPLQIHELLGGIRRAQADPSVALAPVWDKVEEHTMASAVCRAALMNDDFKKAGRQLDLMDSLMPCPLNLHMRGEWCLRRRDSKGALRMFEKCTAAAPRLEAPWRDLARGYGAAGNREKAVKALLKGMEHCPGSQALAEDLVELGHFYRFGRKPEHFARPETHGTSPNTESCWYVDRKGYRKSFESMMARAGGSVEDLEKISIDVGRHGFDAGCEEEIYLRILEIDPGHRVTQARLAGLLIHSDRLDEGEALLAQAGETDGEGMPDDAEVLFHLHTLALKRGDKEASRRWLEAALESDVDHEHSLCAYYANNPAIPVGERESLLREFAREKRSWVAANMAARIALMRKDQHQAVEDALLAWEINPEEKSSFINYTQGLYSIGEYEKLAALLQPGYKAGKLDWTAKWPYSVALYELGHKQEAVRVIDEILRDKRLPKSEGPRLREQRDVWTGYSACPSGDHILGYEENPDRLTHDVVLKSLNGQNADSVTVIPSGSGEETRNELPFDGLTIPGLTEIRLGLVQKAKGLFAWKKPIGTFTVSGIEPRKLRSERLFVTFRYFREGFMYVTARQGKRKLKVTWSEPGAVS